VNVELDESDESGNDDEGDEEEDKRSNEEQQQLDIEGEQDADIQYAFKKEDDGRLHITEIDAQWLNRTLSDIFEDLMAEEV
jgi:hypothetical protein